ncbi:MAG: bifunctional chorismate mutase/prephenate dehydratase [Candidatus Atribacteria bacterium]|nr:bifunctional chorismate mutase/prephenate dehydratase [Candidatus Atribacteria bacterium]
MSILTERTLQKEGKKVRQNLLSDGTGEEPVVITVAFLGEAGSFSSQVARQTFSRDMQYLSCTSFRHIFESVMKGNATHGILPLENTITGSIHGNYELLLEYPEVSVVGERFIKVSQHFALYPGTSRDNIEVLFAHPQGFAQCSRFLETLKRKRIMNVGNTEEAARRTAEFGMGAACITSSESITKYYLTLVEEDIEDQIRNFTRFIIFSRFHRPSLDNDKISCVFALQDRPGTLYECLKVFSEHSINIIKLESKPIPGKPWEYLFYVDWEGNMLEDRYQKAVDELRTKTVFLRILGCYKNMWKK